MCEKKPQKNDAEIVDHICCIDHPGRQVGEMVHERELFRRFLQTPLRAYEAQFNTHNSIKVLMVKNAATIWFSVKDEKNNPIARKAAPNRTKPR